MSTQVILDRLTKVKGSNGKYRAQCPAHGSKGLTLQITEEKNGDTWLYCHAGCSKEEILSSVGLSIREIFGSYESYVRPKYGKKEYERDLYDEFFYEIYKADVKKGIKPTEAESEHFRQIAQRKFRRA